MDGNELGFEERCLGFIWEDATKQIIFYPHLRLIAWRGLLVRHIVLGDLAEIPFNKFNESTEFCVSWRRTWRKFDFNIEGEHDGSNWRAIMGIEKMIGMRCVRIIQRQWLRVFQKRRGDRALALMMATHRRLGAASQLFMLESSVIRMCLEK